MKQKIDKLLNNNYNHLLSVAINITKRYKSTHPDIEFNLLHGCVSKVYNNIEEVNSFLSDDTSFIKYMTKFMKQHFDWQLKRMWKEQKDNDLFTFRPNITNNDYDSKLDNYIDNETADEHSDTLMLIDAENIDEITKLFIKDMLINDIPLERGLKYLDIISIASKLDMQSFELFKLYYLEEMSAKDIFKDLKEKFGTKCMSYTEVVNIVRHMKEKINEKMKCLK